MKIIIPIEVYRISSSNKLLRSVYANVILPDLTEESIGTAVRHISSFLEKMQLEEEGKK